MRKGEKIIIEFKDNGEITSDASGFKGKACMATIEKILGTFKTTLKSSKRKNEFYANETESCVRN